MAGDASTLPLHGAAAKRRFPAGWRARGRAAELADADSGVRVGALALATIVALSLFVVLIAANRPSILTPTTHSGYFPRWMAGPLGGALQGFTNNGETLKWLFTGSILIMYGAYVLVFKHARRLPRRWVIATIVAVHAIFLLSPPLALTDLFNYVNYGRMEVVHGLNPYTTIPVLEPHSDPSYLLSNWHQLLSPYGPLFTLITFAVVPLGVGGSFWALKGLLMLASLGTLVLVWKCARLLGRDPLPAVVFAGLNPIVLVWGLGGDHNDFLMLFFIVLGFYLLLLAQARAAAERAGTPAASAPAASPWERVRGWLVPLSALDVCTGAAFVTATAIKASAAVLIPVVLASLLRAPRRLVQVVLGIVLAGAVAAAASLLAFGLHIPDLSTQGTLVTGESVPNLIGLALGLGGESEGLRVVMELVLLALLLGCCWLAWKTDPAGPALAGSFAPETPGERAGGGEGMHAGECNQAERAITASAWASVALLVTLSWVLPWYVVWVLPLAALSHSRRLRTVTLVFGVYLIIVWAPVSGLLWNALHFYPARTPLGRLHQRYVKELLN
jgi:hypothetical protein